MVNVQLGKYKGFGIKRPHITESPEQMDSKYLINESAKIINAMIQRILSDSKIDLNGDAIQSMKNKIFDEFKKELAENNANLSMYLQYSQKTEEQLMKECEDEAIQHLFEKAVLEKIAELENISVDSEERLDAEEKHQQLYQKVILFLLEENTVEA